MVPDSYHQFFSAAASVSGALIGLLFVAISVVPHKLSGEQASPDFQARAGLAFAALIDSLVLALYALLPGHNLGAAGTVAAILGLSSTLGLGAISAKQARLAKGEAPGEHRRGRLLEWRPRMATVRVATLFALYAVQLATSLVLITSGTRECVSIDATLVIFCFLFAIDRAWELLGGGRTTLTTMLATQLGSQPQASTADEPAVSASPADS
jgi:hypothetical protein